MIAIDTSSLVAFFAGDSGTDTDAVDECLLQRHAVLPAVVLSELLSDPKLQPAVARTLRGFPCLGLSEGYWERAGNLRRRLLSRGLKARLADTLIAQSCIDHNIPLITRDLDFRHFMRLGGLKLWSMPPS